MLLPLCRTENGQGTRDFGPSQDLPKKNLLVLKIAARKAILCLLTLPPHCSGFQEGWALPEQQTSLGSHPSHHSPLPREGEWHSWSRVYVKEVLALSLTLLPCSFGVHLPAGSMGHESPRRGPDEVCYAAKMVWFGWGNKSTLWRHIHSPSGFNKKQYLSAWSYFCLSMCSHFRCGREGYYVLIPKTLTL